MSDSQLVKDCVDLRGRLHAISNWEGIKASQLEQVQNAIRHVEKMRQEAEKVMKIYAVYGYEQEFLADGTKAGVGRKQVGTVKESYDGCLDIELNTDLTFINIRARLITTKVEL